ncbi:hypothetical protein HDU76_001677 [Blyttiomyces sp. JEL0837]|nr:hypothetical protein HDU76_001677 [Blyttiomyces sp. JEL0837]
MTPNSPSTAAIHNSPDSAASLIGSHSPPETLVNESPFNPAIGLNSLQSSSQQQQQQQLSVPIVPGTPSIPLKGYLSPAIPIIHHSPNMNFNNFNQYRSSSIQQQYSVHSTPSTPAIGLLNPMTPSTPAIGLLPMTPSFGSPISVANGYLGTPFVSALNNINLGQSPYLGNVVEETVEEGMDDLFEQLLNEDSIPTALMPRSVNGLPHFPAGASPVGSMGVCGELENDGGNGNTQNFQEEFFLAQLTGNGTGGDDGGNAVENEEDWMRELAQSIQQQNGNEGISVTTAPKSIKQEQITTAPSSSSSSNRSSISAITTSNVKPITTTLTTSNNNSSKTTTTTNTTTGATTATTDATTTTTPRPPRGQPGEFACTHQGCTKTYATLSRLRSHRKIHRRTRRHPCPYIDPLTNLPACGESFFRRQDLERHLLTHESVKKFGPCEGCGCRFTRGDALARHVKRGTCKGKGGGAGSGSTGGSESIVKSIVE